ncbi:SdpA family antimicrobial peptide system protein [Streptomyces sioyaensis]|uniref:SdpA family antimicrobial peptide system protein n=1 Tax=Streptomyces sioyaensis TaxID=67364 RepID=UPI003D74F726
MRITKRIHITTAGEAPHSAAVPRSWVSTIAALWVVASLYVAQSFVPHNVLSLPAQDSARTVATVVAPQGWAFFTKSPKDPVYAPYQLFKGSWKSISLTPHSKASNLFGLDRASRSQGIEVALMLHQKNVKWTSCGNSSTVQNCLELGARKATKATNSSPSPTLCGHAAVVEERPVPWAWRDLSPERHTPERVAVWSVKCP